MVESADDTIRMAADYARTHNLKIIELGDFPDPHRLDDYPDVDRTFLYDVGIEEWIGYFRDAECIFTNSFHGTCLSIIFNKRFYAGNRHGDKVTNLLQLTGLSHRQITDYTGPEIFVDEEDIDYEPVMQRLDAAREQSRTFILNAIHECETGTRTPRDYESWKRSRRYSLIYHSGGNPDGTDTQVFGAHGKIENLSSGNVQYRLQERQINDGSGTFAECGFTRNNKVFAGWRIRCIIDNRWFWYADDGLVLKDKGARYAKVFAAGDPIPFIPVNRIKTVVAEAVWNTQTFVLHLNSGRTSGECRSAYGDREGATAVLRSGSVEYTPHAEVPNTGRERMPKNRFSYKGLEFAGWRIRIKVKNDWKWVLADGGTCPTGTYSSKQHGRRLIIGDGETIPRFADSFDVMVAEATWRDKTTFRERLHRKFAS